jgi:hypothetical protein
LAKRLLRREAQQETRCETQNVPGRKSHRLAFEDIIDEVNVYRLLQFFLPLQNPVGFGIPDFVMFGVAALLLGAILTRGWTEPALRWIAERPRWSMGTLFALPIVLRLLLLPNHPVPVPSVSDDFSYLLLGDTLAHFRLSNPAHPMSRFFETVFVLQYPSYSSIYPVGQGLVLALGQVLFHLPWAGVLLSVGAFCALCYRMLRAWAPPVWALAGGLLAVMQFGPLNQWSNNYWGGAVSAIAGCLVFGGVPRRRYGLVGLGLAIQMLTRPFEALLLATCILPFAWQARRYVPAALLMALLITGAHNYAVTGNPTTLPYMLSRYQYGIPATFTFEKNAVAHRPLSQEQAMDYRAQAEVHGDQPETPMTFIARLGERVRFFRFFFYAPLYIAILFFFPALRERRYLWVAGCIVIFWVGTNIYPYFYPHYVAALTSVFVLVAITGLRRMRGDAMRIVLLLCVARFLFWYGIHFFGNDDIFIATGPYESWDYVNFGDSEGRRAIDRQLTAAPGNHLVFVKYSSQHLLREWIHNEADIDRSRVVRALDLGPDENAKLVRYYPGRKVWLLEPDARPPKLTALTGPSGPP